MNADGEPADQRIVAENEIVLNLRSRTDCQDVPIQVV